MMEENEASRKMIESMSEGSEVEMEEKMRFCFAQYQKLLGWSKEQMEQLERSIRRTVEKREQEEFQGRQNKDRTRRCASAKKNLWRRREQRARTSRE